MFSKFYFAVLVSSMILMQTNTNADSILIDNAESATPWTLESNGGVMEKSQFDDGTPAIMFTLPGVSESKARLKIFPKDLNISESDFLEFDYYLEGGMLVSDVQLRHKDIFDGFYCHYYPLDNSEPMKVRRHLRMKLGRPENVYPSEPFQFEKDLAQPVLAIEFSPVGNPTEKRNIRIGPIRLVKKPFVIESGIVEPNSTDYAIGKYRQLGQNGARYQYEVKCRNVLSNEITLKLSVSGADKTKVTMERSEYKAPPSQAAEIKFMAEIPDNQSSLKDGRYEPVIVTVTADGYPESARELVLLAAAPPKLHPSPRFLDFEAIRQKISASAYMKNAFEEIRKKADQAVASPIILEPFSMNMKFPQKKFEKFWGGDFCGVCCSRSGSTTMFRVLHSDPNMPYNRMQCLGCGRIYISPTLNKTLFSNQFEALGKTLEDLIVAYMVTRDPTYAKATAAALRNMAEVFPTAPWLVTNAIRSKYGGSRWYFASWVFGLGMSYDCLKNSEYLNAADAGKITENLIRPLANELLSHETGGFNMQLKFLDVNIAYLGLALDDPQYLAFSVYSQRGMIPIHNRELTADGFGVENPGYDGFYVDLAEDAMTLRLNGIDLFKNDRFLKVFDSTVMFAGPTGVSAAWGPGGGMTIYKKIYESVYTVTHNSLHAYAAMFGNNRQGGNDQPRSALFYGVESFPTNISAPEFSSVNFPEKGYFVLRDGQGDNFAEVPVYYGGHIRGGHMKLSFEFRAYGRGWSQRQGSVYGKLYDQYYVHPLTYACVTVDELRQKEALGRLIQWDVDGEAKIASAVAGNVYDGVDWERTFVLLEKSLLVIDHVVSKVKHKYDWTHHCPGNYTFSIGMKPYEQSIGEGLAYTVLKDITKGKADSTWSYIIKDGSAGQDKALSLEVVMIGTDPTDVFLVNGPGGGAYDNKYTPFVIARREALETIFATAFVPFKDEKRLSRLTAIPVTSNHNPLDRKDGIGLEISFSQGYTYRILIAYKQGRIESGALVSDKHVAVFKVKE